MTANVAKRTDSLHLMESLLDSQALLDSHDLLDSHALLDSPARFFIRSSPWIFQKLDFRS